jgi:hypothetical protein
MNRSYPDATTCGRTAGVTILTLRPILCHLLRSQLWGWLPTVRGTGHPAAILLDGRLSAGTSAITQRFSKRAKNNPLKAVFLWVSTKNRLS